MEKLFRICKIIYRSKLNRKNLMATGNDGNYFMWHEYHDWSFVKTIWFLIKSKSAWREFITT